MSIAQMNTMQSKKGGIATCKFNKEILPDTSTKFKARKNHISFNASKGILSVNIEGTLTKKSEQIFLTASFEIDNFNPTSFQPGLTIERKISDDFIIFEKNLPDGSGAAIVSINKDTNNNILTSDLKFISETFSGLTAGGKVFITFPRIVSVSSDDPGIEQIKSGEDVELENISEEGNLELTCKLRNVPVDIIGVGTAF
jgi:hypothetical protein